MAGRAQQTRRGCGGGLLRVTSSGAISQPSLVRRQLGELARQKNKERALKAFLAYLHLATPDDAFRKDAQAAVRALGGRVN